MKQFYIIANPEYFKKTMNWNMNHRDIKYTEDKLVMFVANEYVPVTHFEPYCCGYRDTDIESDLKSIYKPYYAILKEDNDNE